MSLHILYVVGGLLILAVVLILTFSKLTRTILKETLGFPRDESEITLGSQQSSRPKGSKKRSMTV